VRLWSILLLLAATGLAQKSSVEDLKAQYDKIHAARAIMLDVSGVADAIPLIRDAQGAYRVGGTRVTLDLVVRAFNRGATAEEIAQKYDSLQLSDVYQVIGYYLKHADELTEYFESRSGEQEALLSSHQEWSPKGLRDRLLARRKPQ
jgi:uncharacterized protein (DUF433 family)